MLVRLQQQPQEQQHHVVALIMIGQAANDDCKDDDHCVPAPSQHLPSPSAMDYFHQHQRQRITKRKTFLSRLVTRFIIVQ